MEHNNDTHLENIIEAILYHQEDPVSIDKLAEYTKTPLEVVDSALNRLEESFKHRGVRLLRHEKAVSLATAPQASKILKKIVTDEYERSLGKAGIETLTVVAYLAPVEKPLIDYVRGVNSHATLRTLLSRGLIKRSRQGKTHRYEPTHDTLMFLGLSSLDALPNYEETRARFYESYQETTAQEEV